MLEQWGAFVLRRVDANSTRLIIRSHGKAKPVLWKTLDYLLFEPIHFVMERKMMLGIKHRAERHAGSSRLLHGA